jgi:hypothetical protein
MDGTAEASALEPAIAPPPVPAPKPTFARNNAVVGRSIKGRHNEPHVARETNTTRKLRELEQIVRRVAATDPYLETVDHEVFCSMCEARGRAHTDECVWLAAKGWMRRFLP